MICIYDVALIKNTYEYVVCPHSCLFVCVWYVLHWLSWVTVGHQWLKPHWERGERGQTEGSWGCGRDISSWPVTSLQHGQEVGELGGYGTVGDIRALSWIFWSSSWVNLTERDPLPQVPPTYPPASSLLSSASHLFKSSCVCDYVCVRIIFLSDLHLSIMPCVSSCCLAFISLSLLSLCLYLCLRVCLLCIRSLWPCIPIECLQTALTPCWHSCRHTWRHCPFL